MIMKLTYKDSGVNKEAGYETVKQIKDEVLSTYTKGVMSSLGGFAGLFKPDLTNIKNPVLVSGTDGVGTKLKLAFMMNKHDTIGIDCVAMCVNDVLCQGAQPLFFLDYIAIGELEPTVAKEIVSGIAEGCRQSEMALIGGETAEMPGFYQPGEYDVAGFVVGLVDEDKLIDNSKIKAGDVLIGLPSSGVHSNGFSLVRKIIFDKHNKDLNEPFDHRTLGEVLLEPTKIYVKDVLPVIDKINGLCHVTGGGFYENVPRMLPENVHASINTQSIPKQKIFDYLQELGGIETDEMYGTFNMGIGMVLAVDPKDVQSIQDHIPNAVVLGECVDGEKGVTLCHA